MASATVPVTAGERPRLRGVSHQLAFYLALLAGTALVALARDARAMSVTALYVTLLAGMFGVSATLHRSDWGPRAFAWLRRADHAMIFAFIAGTYTPICVLALDRTTGTRLLVFAWSAAGLGILRAVVWPHAPRAITSMLFVAVGWVAIGYLPEVSDALDPLTFTCFMTGGGLFTLGAFVYLLRRPDPWPTVFGYHEVFHVLIIAGCACHFVAIARIAAGR